VTASLAALLLAGSAIQTRAQDLGIHWAVLASGGSNDASSNDFRLASTLGQPVIGLTGDRTSTISQGFWFPLNLLSSVPFEFRAPEAPFALHNYPNPFTTLTTISYTLDQPSQVELVIVDLAGREIAVMSGGYQSAGEHQFEWGGIDDGGAEVPAGIYVYTLKVRGSGTTAGESTSRQKMLLVR